VPGAVATLRRHIADCVEFTLARWPERGPAG